MVQGHQINKHMLAPTDSHTRESWCWIWYTDLCETIFSLLYNFPIVSVLYDLYVMIGLNFAITLFLWRFAKNESREHSKSRHYNSKYCYDDCYMCSHRWLRSSIVTTVTCWQDEVPVTMVVPPLKHKCCHMRVVNYIIPNVNGPPRVIRQLLLLAGDVETNPGPGNGQV